MANAGQAGAEQGTQAAQPPPSPASKSIPIRLRKKSLFGKAPRPSDKISEPVPAIKKETISEDSSSASDTANRNDASRSSKGKRSSSSPSSKHKRSPSLSTSSVASSNREAEAMRGSEASQSQTVGRQGLLSAGHSSPWYSRRPLSSKGGLPFSKDESKPSAIGRDRSASVSAAIGSSSKGPSSFHDRAADPQDNDSSRWIGSSPGSPNRIMRTFSRRSVYSLHGDPSASASSNETSRYDDADEGSLKERRFKLFSHGKSKGLGETTPYLSDRINSSETHMQSPGFLRRASSRSLLKSKKKGHEGTEREGNPKMSTDSLASTNTTSTSRGLSKRAGELMSRTSSFAPWGQKSRGLADASQENLAPNETNAQQDENQRKANAVAEQDAEPKGSLQDSRSTLTVPSATDSEETSAEGIPKRLSGWLINMLGGEHSNSAPTTVSAANSTTSDSVLNMKRQSSGNLSRRINGDADSAVSNSRSSQPPSSAAKAKTAGLLSTLAATGRNRMDAASSGSANHNVSRSGLDRALRYFTDGHESDQAGEEGIWLLGVWHGPQEPQASSNGAVATQLGPTIAVSPPLPSKEDPSVLGTESEVLESETGHDVASDANDVRRTRETSPSIESVAPSVDNVEEVAKDEVDKVVPRSSEAVNGSDDAALVARNPPTPQTSPRTEYARASGLHQARAGQELNVGSSMKLLAAIAGTAEKVPSFQQDFSSRIWCTYRSHFIPISRDGRIVESEGLSSEEARAVEELSDPAKPNSMTKSVTQSSDSETSSPEVQSRALPQSDLGAAFGISTSSSPPAQVSLHPSNIHNYNGGAIARGGGGGTGGLGEKMGIPNLWNRATAAAQAYGFAGRSGLTTDAGWGCMLRTGQSVLANALLNVHLGRNWRRLVKPLPAQLAPLEHESPAAFAQWRKHREQYAKYARLISWFLDDPNLACPFGIHRMAREGKRLGKEVGEWFGPSTAAGAIKKLVDEFDECKMGCIVANDGVIYLNLVKAAASIGSEHPSHAPKRGSKKWERPVLILIGIRLGLEGVHPMYHDSVKATFSFPQSVGIAGGRPSSSYYFVGYQGNSLFYLDPHYVRSSIPFKAPSRSQKEDEEWWTQAYSEQELATFHTDRSRRMPMKSLDPSMLLGFLIEDENSLQDFLVRVKALPRPIFSVQDCMPKWMRTEDYSGDDWDDEEERAIESISETSFDGEQADQSVTEDQSDHDAKENGDRQSTLPKLAVAKRSSRRQSGHVEGSGVGGAEDQSSYTGVTTPRSEATFELVDRQALPSNSSHVGPAQQSSSPLVQRPPSPVAFPTLQSYDDADEAESIEREAESIQREPVEATNVGRPSSERLAADQTPPVPFPAAGAGDIESNWEDLQDERETLSHEEPLSTSANGLRPVENGEPATKPENS